MVPYPEMACTSHLLSPILQGSRISKPDSWGKMSGLNRRDPKYSRDFYKRTSVSKEEDQGLGGRRAPGEAFRSSKALGLWQLLSSPLPILDLTCSCAFQGVMPSPWACLPTPTSPGQVWGLLCRMYLGQVAVHITASQRETSGRLPPSFPFWSS